MTRFEVEIKKLIRDIPRLSENAHFALFKFLKDRDSLQYATHNCNGVFIRVENIPHQLLGEFMTYYYKLIKVNKVVLFITDADEAHTQTQQV